MNQGVDHDLGVVVRFRGAIGQPEATVEVSGDFDRAQVPRFEGVVGSLPDTLTRLTVDLRCTTVLDSAALGALIRLRRNLDGRAGALTTIVDKPFQRRVMAVTGLSEHLNVVERSA